MDAESYGAVPSRLLDSAPSPDAALAAQILAACPTVDVVAGEPYFRSSLPAGPLLIVERGFVVLRMAVPRANRSIITCDAAPGRIILPPASEEVLVALVDSKLPVCPGGGIRPRMVRRSSGQRACPRADREPPLASGTLRGIPSTI